MGGDGVTDVNAEAGEGVDRMVLYWGLLQCREPVGAETRIDNELAEVGRFSEGDRGEVW